jgi:ribosomal protein S3
MSQKINPVSLRLFSNKKRESIWYNKYNYSSNLILDLLIRRYIQNLSSINNLYLAKIILQLISNSIIIDTFYYHPNSRLSTSSKIKKDQIISPSTNNIFNSFLSKKNFNSFENKIILKCINILSKKFLILSILKQKYLYLNNEKKSSILYNSFVNNIDLNLISDNQLNCHFINQHFQKLKLPQNQLTDNLSSINHKKRIETVISNWSLNSVNINWIHLGNPCLSAELLAQYIATSLLQRESFRRITQRIIKKVSETSNILGLRIICSGRFGGAEMARVESIRYGQTSLHVFSKKIDYSLHTALIPQGLFGIKVWLCFK